MLRSLFTLMVLVALPLSTLGSPFETCPSKAFLFQGNPVTVYGVNLVSGSYSPLEDDVGMSVNVNGVGFNDQIDDDGTNRRYMYGFSTTTLEFVRLDKDFQATVLPITNQPSGSFYVGDVYDNHYYMYRTGTGFYKINLDPDASNYLDVQTIITNPSVRLTDFAFHPSNDKLYGIDNNNGKLFEFNTDTGVATELGNTGETGTFGAAYFDVNGYFYVSRNQDGQIYRVNLSNDNLASASPDYSAVKFADGPLSNQNDGARCANAPLIDEDEGASTIDFGDAPDTYSTSIAGNGPRHEIGSGIYLGTTAPDGETDAQNTSDPSTSSDDASGSDDEDGLGLVTGLVRGLDNLVVVTASQQAYLQAWFDWNGDGDFADAGEHVFEDKLLSAGANTLVVRVPLDATTGSSWVRLRLGSQTGIDYFGGATDGEVEDHTMEVSDAGVTYTYYPSASGWTTLAYEDLWPLEGDYDMNDVVFHYRTVTVERDDKLQRVDFHGQLVAIGASYHNGFAIRVPGVLASAVDTQKMRFRYAFDGEAQTEQANPIEAESSELIAVVTNDVWDLVDTSCSYYRTSANCTDDIQFEFELSLPFTELQPAAVMSTLYDPFIFATPNRYHGSHFSSHPGREWEMHLADVAPTEQADTSIFKTGDDTSDSETERFFKNSNNLPWAMEVATSWKHPRTGVDLLKAYPNFRNHIESGKAQDLDWYQEANRVEGKVFP